MFSHICRTTTTLIIFLATLYRECAEARANDFTAGGPGVLSSAEVGASEFQRAAVVLGKVRAATTPVATTAPQPSIARCSGEVRRALCVYGSGEVQW